MSEAGMNWVQRRGNLDANIPDAWNLICIAIGQAADSFASTRHARERKLVCVATRIGSCVRIVIAPVSGGPSEDSVDVCLDRAKGRVLSRNESEEKASLRFVSDPDGKAILTRESGKTMT